MNSLIRRLVLGELSRHRGRFLLLVLALALGFAAYVATTAFAAGVLRSVRGESRALLGGDLVLSSRGLLPENLEGKLGGLPLAGRVRLYEFPTMVGGTGLRSRLVEVRAVEGPYPLAGNLVTQPALGRPFGGLVVEASLAEAWSLRPAPPDSVGSEALLEAGQALRLGGSIEPIRALLLNDDSQQAAGFTLGPRVLLDLDRAKALGLVGPRSRLSGRLLLALEPGADPAVVARQLRARLKTAREAGSLSEPLLRVRTHEEAATALARPLRNLHRFVGLLGLSTLLLAGLGGWVILTAFLESRTREVAILRCLGAPPAAPVSAYGLLALLLLGASLALGTLLGLGGAALLPRLLRDLVPAALGAALRGARPALPPPGDLLPVILALVLLLGPALLALAKVRPLALLREAEATTPPSRIAILFPLLAAVLAGSVVVRQAPSLRVGLGMAGALALLLGLLFGLSRLLVALYRRLGPRLPLALRLGLGQLGARPALSTLLMAVMGLSVFLILATHFIQADLVAPLATQKGDGTRANFFLLDVPPEAEESLRSRLEAASGAKVQAAGLVRGRLVSVAGRAPQEHLHHDENEAREGEGERRAEHFRNREQNLSWRSTLSTSERVVAGAWWTEEGGTFASPASRKSPPFRSDAVSELRPETAWGGEGGTFASPTSRRSPPFRPEASLEEGFARTIGAGLGDELVFEVSGRSLSVRVTSLRKVRWTSFQPNFFILLHPSVLEDAPATRLLALEVEDAALRERLRGEIVQTHPSVTLIDVGEVVAKVGRMLDLVNGVARALAGLMLASALLVLGASLLASRLGRSRDLAVLRALGASNRLLLWSLVWEFLVLGGSASGAAAVLAWLSARLYATRVLELDSHPSIVAGLLLMAGTALATIAVGLLGSRRALAHKPLEVLRGQ